MRTDDILAMVETYVRCSDGNSPLAAFTAREAIRNAVEALQPDPRTSAWWALVMGAAASIEDAANCLRDPDAQKQADGAAKHYREAAQKLMAVAGVPASDSETKPHQPPMNRNCPETD
jgi:hypothetical protein